MRKKSTAPSSAKHPGGRPTLYDVAYCAVAIDLGKQGKSFAQMAAHFDVARSTIDQWAQDHKEFSEALNRARAHCQAWWEDKGQSGMELPGFNAAVWKKSVEARFRDDYTERQEVEHSGAVVVDTSALENLTVDQREQLRSIAKAITAKPKGDDQSA